MITKDNLKALLTSLKFIAKGEIYSKHFDAFDCSLQVDFKAEKLIYPIEKGFVVNENQTCNFSSPENFVVFECVHRLLSQGYHPQHIELEPRWKLGHLAKSRRADVLVKNQQNEPLLIIECKTAGREFENAWKDTKEDGAQLFSYFQQERAISFVCLYASDIEQDSIKLYQQIISLKDNDKILADHPDLKGFSQANNVTELFEVWKYTYDLDATQKGIFESNIQPYQIGKNNYTLDIDTKPVDVSDKKGKYHEFRTILRKYNVSRRENAFEVLVNLFLCKIVDERFHQDNLTFYWKGKAYDNYYDLVDRLQALYHYGMKEFLKQDIVYISEQQIDDAFWAASRNATKDAIKAMFRQLKFFKGLDFEFIKVHNQKQFDKNAEILIDMIKMWQNLRLLSTGQNQFLGDMFEFFLDNGIKQSEGQFFTPVPICKFIVASLPLEQAIINSNEPLKAIDYACGAGHFLNEYALSITPLVAQHKQANINDYYKAIVGIEKEDRLAKVAKVSAFMYGQDDIQIIDADALDNHEQIKRDSFNCLVANPPFAVEDFLLTLPEAVRESYQLFKTVNDTGNKNIQCFFLERAKQLLAPNGIAGIIVPSSILNNSDNTHIKTREILLQYFDFIAIVELGSGTFGKTGTNTVVLFLRRKAHNPTQAKQFKNRVDDFFGDLQHEQKVDREIYNDIAVISIYCQYQGFNQEGYQRLLNNQYDQSLFDHALFNEYQKAFDKLTAINTLKNQKQFKAKSPEEQFAELEKRLLNYVREIEKDKLFYFMLAQANPTSVLIVKSSSDNKEQKAFLGYEWSGAKGSEGIKYNVGESANDIITPLYNPNDRNDSGKINTLICDNFNGINNTIPEALTPYVSRVKLVDMLDFSRIEFNKAISLNTSKKVEIESKWDIYSLDKLVSIVRGASPRPIDKYITEDADGVSWIKIGDVSVESKYVTETKEKITKEGAKRSRKVSIGDFILSNSMSFGRPYILNIDGYVHDGWLILSNFDEKIYKDYLYEILSNNLVQHQFKQLATGTTVDNLNIQKVSAVKIPLPPLPIQQQIIDECQAVDDEVDTAKSTISQVKADIEQIMVNVQGDKVKLGDVCDLITKGTTPTSIGFHFVESGINFIKIESIDNEGMFNKSKFAFIDNVCNEKMTRSQLKENDVLFSIAGALGRVAIVNSDILPANTNQALAIIRLKKDISFELKYLYLILKSETIQSKIDELKVGIAQQNLSLAQIANFEIPLPPFEVQKRIISKIEVLESKKSEAKKIIDNSKARKEAVLKAYL